MLDEKRFAAAYCESLEPLARLEFHVGWSGCTRPPTTGGRGVATGGLQAKVELVFEGSKRPEAG